MSDLVYLDNACTSFPKATGLDDALADFFRCHAFNTGRGGHKGAVQSAQCIARLRDRIASRIGAHDPSRIILTSGATHAINLTLLGALDSPTTKRPRVIVTSMAHNAMTRPLARLHDLERIEVVQIKADAKGRIDAQSVLDADDDNTVMVCLTHASNVCGTIQPVARICAGLRAKGSDALVLVDAAQTVGVLDIDVLRDDIDLLAFSGHKGLLGPTGVGGLYVGPRAFNTEEDPEAQPLQPVIAGGTGGSSTAERMPSSLPSRFEPGTPNTLGAYALLAALDATANNDHAGALQHERALIARLRDRLGDIPACTLVGVDDPQDATPVQSFTIEGIPPGDVATILDQSFSIAVRAGLHCAPCAHKTLGTFDLGGTVRVSPGPSSTTDEIDTCCDALAQIAAHANT